MIRVLLALAIPSLALVAVTIALTHPNDDRSLHARIFENLGGPLILIVLLPEFRRIWPLRTVLGAFGRTRP